MAVGSVGSADISPAPRRWVLVGSCLCTPPTPLVDSVAIGYRHTTLGALFGNSGQCLGSCCLGSHEVANQALWVGCGRQRRSDANA